MLGKSSRFFNAGYEIPKYKLPINNSDLFSLSVSSFKKYFDSDKFIFIVRKDFNDLEFLKNRINSLKIKKFKIIQYDFETRGQADSVRIAIESEDSLEELYIFNIDTILFNFKKLSCTEDCAGYLEVFHGSGDHWSFVLPDKNDNQFASMVVEKKRISDLCSNGLYYFKTKEFFEEALNIFINNQRDPSEELYVAPLYSELINLGFKIRYKIIDKESIGFCGTPDEYQDFVSESKNNF